MTMFINSKIKLDIAMHAFAMGHGTIIIKVIKKVWSPWSPWLPVAVLGASGEVMLLQVARWNSRESPVPVPNYGRGTAHWPTGKGT